MVLKAAWLYDQGDALRRRSQCGQVPRRRGRLPAPARRRCSRTAAWATPRNTTSSATCAKRCMPRIAPVSPQLILCFIAEKVLGLPKSY